LLFVLFVAPHVSRETRESARRWEGELMGWDGRTATPDGPSRTMQLLRLRLQFRCGCCNCCVR